MEPTSSATGTRRRTPAVSFAGDSGVGKTSLLEGVIVRLRERGLRVGVVKHSGGFEDPDRPGKDSRRLRDAGAERLVLASEQATVLFASHPQTEPSFEERLELLGERLDVVLVESYRSAGLPTLEVLRRGHCEEPKLRGAGALLAIVADFEVPGAKVPVLPLDDPAQIADFLVDVLSLAGLPDPG